MNAFTIYLVMQLDSFILGLSIIAVASLIGGAMLYMHADMNFGGEDLEAADRISKRLIVLGCVLSLLAIVTPNSKTAAAMLVLPAIVNNPTAQQEAGEVYQLAKKALRNAAEEK